ncbi:exosortase family protein XrtF [Aureitalea sp. L0-47]|uniref:exosortase family protein XrtF n=1 Tax=Aureitalea sp. L0-47 TaxID=2816962 RepID=UPI00223875CC|nr:exosortase family protein XrtF [Aureitalea sp. L0-47]MCW5518718.1 exosortase family protein XrtF [Aureitalea sp. L0-47]
MKALLFKYRSVLRFIALFLGTYVLLSLCYGLYLKLSEGGEYPPDVITHLVAKQSSDLLNSFGYDAEVVPGESKPMMKLIVEGKFLAQIIQGCNSLSIIILFTSFIVAFAERFRKTLLFILAGGVLVYAVNILRIAILSVALYEYPQHKEILHGVVFPGLIYSMVFLLWMLWIRMLKTKVGDA